MAIETVRISPRGREQLITLKRRTGITTWNVLCRWALCASLSDPTPPRSTGDSAGDAIEMTWKTFAGDFSEIYLGLLKERCMMDGIEANSTQLSTQNRLHVHRGIAALYGSREIKSIEDLASATFD